MTSDMYALSIITENRTGVLRDVATVMADYQANIQMIQQSILTTGPNIGKAYLYFEFKECGDHGGLIADLARVPSVVAVTTYPPFSRIFGSRVISSAAALRWRRWRWGRERGDRHTSVASGYRWIRSPCRRAELCTAGCSGPPPRASILVLAGSLMGGEIREPQTGSDRWASR